ncbi:MAG TPA: DUF4352 domain-containing protein [Ktedonobacteraceae bacterium]|nr:DUF4352 domain-containing protein [Ktedonobacteraceae bacterium]
MTIFDGILILAVLGCVLSLVSLGYFLVRRKFRRAKCVLLALASFFVVYAAVLVSVSLASPQQVLAMHQDRCFDDWCLSVEQVVQQPTIGSTSMLVHAHSMFDLVTVRVASRARAVSQRALDAQVYLLDTQGQRYDPDPAGQHVLDASGQGGQPLDSELAPGGSFTRTVVFDVPKGVSHLALVVSHGLFPDVLVIGSDQSFLHKPTIIQLPSP